MAIHTVAVTKAKRYMKDNKVLGNYPPPISDEEATLRRPQWTTLSQLHSGHCRLLHTYKSRLDPAVPPNYPNCGVNPQDVPHLFSCTAHRNNLATVNL